MSCKWLQPVHSQDTRRVSKFCTKILFVFALYFSMCVYGHDVISTNLTFGREIGPILSEHCQGCHGSGSSLPLMTYKQVRPWAVAVKEQVLTRAMPPWGAVKGFGHFEPENALSESDIELIAAWVIGGAPEGDPSTAESPQAVRSASPPNPQGEVRELERISTRSVLRRTIQLEGIRPLTAQPVESIKITATLPDGEVEPLLWLYHYDPRQNRAFQLRRSALLPKGTSVASSAPLEFVLQIRDSQPER